MKKILLVSAALCLSSAALANGGMAPVATATTSVADFTPGVYVGIQGGYADTGFRSADFATTILAHDGYQSTKIDHNTGPAGRIFVGYDFHKYFAVEAGYFLVGQKTNFTATNNALGEADQQTSSIRTQAFDLVGKIKAPIMDNFGVYAKAGVGYLMTDGRNNIGVDASGHDTTTSVKNNVDKFDLVYGLGTYYTFANNWTVDASYTRYNSGHSKCDESWQPVVDFYAVGINYKFDLPV